MTIDNKDIGFVRVGQTAAVKLEAFNFTRYGTVPAVVTRVSADAVVDEKRGTVFGATLRFERRTVSVDGVAVPINAGLNMTAELQTGTRRVIEFLLSPVQRMSSESGRER